MKRCIKWLLLIAVTLVLLAVAALLVVQQKPNLIVVAVNKYTPYSLSADAINLKYFPLSLNAETVVVQNKAKQTALRLGKLDLQSSLKHLLKSKPTISLNLNDGEVWLQRFASASESQSSKSNSSETNDSYHLHELITRLDLNVENVVVYLDQASKVNLNTIKSVKKNTQQGWEAQTNSIDIDVAWQDSAPTSDVALDLKMSLTSKFIDNKSVLDIHIPSLDVSGLVSEGEQERESEALGSEKKIADALESPIDWRWMKSVKPVSIDLLVDELQQANNKAEKVNMSIGLGKAIQVSGAAIADWSLSDSARFNDALKVEMQLTPLGQVTSKQDVDLNVMFSSSIASVEVEGKANLNGQAGNQLSLKVQAKQMPVLLNATNEGIAHWFPLNLVSSLDVGAQAAKLQLSSLTMGNSDLKGELSAGFEEDQPLAITFDLQSKLLELVPQIEISDVESISDTSAVDKGLQQADDQLSEGDQSRFFSKETINWSWLQNIRVNGELKVDEIRADQTVLSNVSMPIVLDDDGLQADKFSINLADGLLTGKVTLVAENNDANIGVNLQVDNVILEALNLLPKEQLRGGKMLSVTELTTYGQSMYDLASNLNGALKIEVNDGVIGNDTFELIGSDLVLELLKKLNPFMANDPSTELDCAIVNLRIKSGQVEIDNSIAIETTKISIVADGSVDLQNEKLDIAFTPKARQGVGLNVGSLVKFLKVGGRLDSPKPVVSAAGVLKTGVAIGAAVSTGGATLLADGLSGMATAGAACENANSAFN